MRILSRQQLKSEKGINYSDEHLRRLEIAGRFPKRAKLGDHPNAHCFWVESEVDAWIATLIAERDAELLKLHEPC
jgi:prophage regulatory protein